VYGYFFAKTPHDPTDSIEQLCGEGQADSGLRGASREFRRLVDPRLDGWPRVRLDASEFVQDSFVDFALSSPGYEVCSRAPALA
jgi:hypothetical protein